MNDDAFGDLRGFDEFCLVKIMQFLTAGDAINLAEACRIFDVKDNIYVYTRGLTLAHIIRELDGWTCIPQTGFHDTSTHANVLVFP